MTPLLLGGHGLRPWMIDERVAAVIEHMHSRAMLLGSESSSPANRTTFGLGERTVELIVPVHVNASHVPIEGAFFTVQSEAPDFQITVLDNSVAGGPPTFDWPSSWNEPFGAMRGERSYPHRFAFDIHSRSFCTFDPRSGHAVVWFHDVTQIPYWVAATPFRLQLSWMADTFDGEMIHAAGVRLGDEAVLIVGPSGAGKSTLALASVLAGHTLLGDDFLLLTGNRAHPVYRRTKAHDASLSMLGDNIANIGSVINAGVVDQKRIIETNLADMESIGCKVGAVFVPRIGCSTGVTTVNPSKVLLRTVGPSMQGLLGGSDATLHRIARLVSSVPTYEITVGPDLAENVKALERTTSITGDRTPFS